MIGKGSQNMYSTITQLNKPLIVLLIITYIMYKLITVKYSQLLRDNILHSFFIYLCLCNYTLFNLQVHKK